MTLNFSIEYKTEWGENLVLCIGGKSYPMAYVADGVWECRLVRFSAKHLADYHYEVIRDGATLRSEWKGHSLVLPEIADDEVLDVKDMWNARPADSPFWSSAFTGAIFGRRPSKASRAPKSPNVLMKVAMPVIRPGEVLAVTGSGKAFKNWTKYIVFDDCQFPVWNLLLDVKESFAYKLLILDKETKEPIEWEDGADRYFSFDQGYGGFRVEANIFPRFRRREWKGAGTAIPVFSLRSEDDFGVGEFYDLKKMVDWAASTGQSILQLLPINDTTMLGTWEDSYPYNPNSTFALHPQYINLPAAGVEEDSEYKSLKDELNSLAVIDYERVNSSKLRLLKKAFDKTFKKLSKKKEYIAFVDANREWLMPYAAFCLLRDLNGTPDFSKWKGFAKFNKKKVESLCAEHTDTINFWYFVQYHLDKQLSEVCRYAHSKGVVFKGDLPIGISRTSVDAWIYPELFNMDSQAGAPPDAFSEDGQNWGFPTYNWDRMAQDGYAWWKARLGKMSEYFDAFRIDHILGFFRIWEIPLAYKSGLEGYFSPALPYQEKELRDLGFDPFDCGLFIEDPRKAGYFHPKIGARKSDSYSSLGWWNRDSFDRLYDDFFYRRNNQFWKDKAMQKLPALLDSTGMLACGEDLGMIPSTVPEVMSSLRILSLEIQRMPKSVEEEFAHPANYPYLSVCTTSTHDMNPIRAWWEEDRELTSRFYYNMIGGDGPVPQTCEPWICRRILEQHLWSPAMLTVLPLQDWLSMDGELRRENPDEERINVPANSRHYWRYRMHLTIEKLASAEDFNNNLSAMIARSGRALQK